VTIEPVSCDSSGFAAWHRSEDSAGDCPGDRGEALWFYPSNAELHPSAGRILFLHGGSYVYYSPTSVSIKSMCAKLTKLTKMPVLSIDYRMMPEHLFPAPVDDAVRAAEWITQHMPLDINAAGPLFAVGDSAGGGLAVLTVLEAHASGRAAFAGVGLFSPYCDLSASMPSYATRAASEDVFDPLFGHVPAQECREAGAKVIPGDWDPKDPRCSPVFARDKLALLPPTRIHVGDAEVMRDESLALALNAAAAGATNITVRTWELMWHDFVYYSEGCCLANEGAEYSEPLSLLEADAAVADVAEHIVAWAEAPGHPMN